MELIPLDILSQWNIAFIVIGLAIGIYVQLNKNKSHKN